MSRLSPVLSGVAAALALALAACGGATDSSGLATLVQAAPAAETVAESQKVETAGITDPTSETTRATVAATTAETATAGRTVAPITDTATTETTIPTADDADAADGPPTPTTAQPNPAEPGGDEDLSDEEQLLRFADCMRDNGVDFPDPVVQADGTVRFGIRPGADGAAEAQDLGRDPDLPAAAEACTDLLQGLTFGGGATTGPATVDITELQDSLLEFARCMRDNGVDMGDPDFGDLGTRGGGNDGPTGGPIIQVWELSGDSPAGVDFGDPDVAAALEACRAEMNIGRLGGSGPRSGS